MCGRDDAYVLPCPNSGSPSRAGGNTQKPYIAPARSRKDFAMSPIGTRDSADQTQVSRALEARPI